MWWQGWGGGRQWWYSVVVAGIGDVGGGCGGVGVLGLCLCPCWAQTLVAEGGVFGGVGVVIEVEVVVRAQALGLILRGAVGAVQALFCLASWIVFFWSLAAVAVVVVGALSEVVLTGCRIRR